MITKDNFKVYQSLYNRINEALNLKGDTNYNQPITDIDDYFMELENIRNYVQGVGTPSDPENDPVFLILPADEGIFAIDANTRKISIPNDFARNGVAVQGDELAEILYFSIDRYFDTTDLYYKDIFVQWEIPASGSSATGDKGLSVTINKTLSMEPGKVIFGWPLTSEITKNPGNVKFSVRFYERGTDSHDQEILTYSFSTLTATIKINPALDFEIDDSGAIDLAIIDKNNLIYQNLRKSEAEGVDVPAVMPTFDIVNFKPAEFQTQVYNLEDGVTFKGRAFFQEGDDVQGFGLLSYTWHREDRNKELITIQDVPEYIPINEEVEIYNEYDVYFTKTGNDVYTPYKGTFPPEEGVIVYKRFATHTPTIAGVYSLLVDNNAGRGNTKTAASNIERLNGNPAWKWTVPFAQNPEFDYTDGQAIIMNSDAEGNYTADVNIDVISPDNGALTYQWKYGQVEGQYSNLEGKIEKALISISEEGYYILEAMNAKNNDTASAESASIRVTRPPDVISVLKFILDNGTINQIEIIPNDIDNNDHNINMSNSTHTLTVDIANMTNSDEVTYQWYYVEGEENIAIEGAVSATYDIPLDDIGSDICVRITNIYNEHSQTYISPLFAIKK